MMVNVYVFKNDKTNLICQAVLIDSFSGINLYLSLIFRHLWRKWIDIEIVIYDEHDFAER